MRKTLIPLAAAVLLAGLLAGCSGDGAPAANSSSTGSPSAGPSAPDSASGVTVNVTIRGDDVTPNGDRIDAKVGEPVTLNIDADRGGELHVHSTPEQHIEYPKGTTTAQVRIDKPGIVDVEDHVADVVVVQLEVS